MHLGMQQVQKLSQRLVMTPQMQQSVKLLQMNTMELENLVDQELLENPFLEIEEEGEESSGEAAADEATEREKEIVREERQTDPETGEPAPDDSYDTAPEQKKETEEEDSLTSDAMEEHPEQFDEVDTDWSEVFEEQYRSASYTPPPDDSDERSFDETIARGESLYERLVWQLRVSALEGRDFEIGMFLIGSIDENGYLRDGSTLEECAREFHLELPRVEEILARVEQLRAEDEATAAERLKEEFKDKKQEAALYLLGFLRSGSFQRQGTIETCAERFGVKPTYVEHILSIIQDFDPSGVGARDLPECLYLQLAAQGELDVATKEILTEHWERLTRKKFREISRETGESEEKVAEVFDKVGTLNPAPGRAYSKDQPAYITPDVYVRQIDGRYMVYLNEGQVAHLRLSKTYRNILLQGEDYKGDPKEREYALDKYRSAVNFIKNIEKRRSTVLRVTEAIMEVQRDFLEHGVSALHPLSLNEIAERVGMHESTISRVTSGKYVHTPQGLFELKFFFSSGIASDQGEAASSRAIRQKIRHLIDEEDPRKPLSDDKIANLLKQQGFSIARRTVAKYREQMKILPTNLRRLRG